MEVRFLTAIAGDGFYFAAGEVASLPDAMGAEYCAAGFAEAIAKPAQAKMEKSTSKAPKQTR